MCIEQVYNNEKSKSQHRLIAVCKISEVENDSRQELSPLLERLGHIDVFLHDSLHTLEHMQWEYETAWSHLNPGGFLLSHDVLWNRAFRDKCRSTHAKPVIYRTLGILEKTRASGADL